MRRNAGLTREITSVIKAITGTTVVGLHTNLLKNGTLDSMGIIKLITEIESRFGFEFPGAEITPATFSTVSSIVDVSSRYINEPTA